MRAASSLWIALVGDAGYGWGDKGFLSYVMHEVFVSMRAAFIDGNHAFGGGLMYGRFVGIGPMVGLTVAGGWDAQYVDDLASGPAVRLSAAFWLTLSVEGRVHVTSGVDPGMTISVAVHFP